MLDLKPMFLNDALISIKRCVVSKDFTKLPVMINRGDVCHLYGTNGKVEVMHFEERIGKFENAEERRTRLEDETYRQLIDEY